MESAIIDLRSRYQKENRLYLAAPTKQRDSKKYAHLWMIRPGGLISQQRRKVRED